MTIIIVVVVVVVIVKTCILYWKYFRDQQTFVIRFGRSVSTYYSNDLASLRPPTRLENTYQLGPRRAFPVDRVQLIIKQILEKYLEHEQYKSHLCGMMSKKLSEVRNHLLDT